METRKRKMSGITLAALAAAMGIGACGGGGADVVDDGRVQPLGAAVTLVSYGPNAVSRWDEVAAATITGSGTAVTTPEEQAPNYALDLATLHVAMYDALVAITGTHRPFAITPTTPSAGASPVAAAAAAAYGVLRALFPNRSALYQPAYDAALAAIPDGPGKTRGLELGAEVAAGVVALRANDGRTTALPPYVPGTAPGQFRGVNPIGRTNPYVRPFLMTSAAQFRADGPPALGSATYAEDVARTQALGGAASTERTAEQTDTARFHTEPPPRFWPRNLRPFAMTHAGLADNARLMAKLYVAHADATIGCFESKYHYQFWRPFSAITLADTDGNPATGADPSWTPVVPTPNHPEYPAAHGCAAGAAAEVLRDHYGTKKMTFSFDSQAAGVVNKVHIFSSTDEMQDELQWARIWGGMHFHTSAVHGAVLGMKTGKWVTKQAFQPRK